MHTHTPSFPTHPSSYVSPQKRTFFSLLAWSRVCTVTGLVRAPLVLLAESKKETSTSYLSSLLWEERVYMRSWGGRGFMSACTRTNACAHALVLGGGEDDVDRGLVCRDHHVLHRRLALLVL